MLSTKDFSLFENQNNFDFKGFLLKIASYWKWFLACLIVTFFIAYQVNIRKEKIFGMDASIVIKDENNPFFTSNTSLVFNWGGTSDKVQTVINTLKSRTHNEYVVDRLEFYIDYLVKGKYNFQDVYGETPFYIDIDKNKNQLAGIPVMIKFLSEKEYVLSIPFDENTSVQAYNYAQGTTETVNVAAGTFEKKYTVGETVQLPFLSFKLLINNNPGMYTGNEYYVRFNSFDGTVAGYKGLNVEIDTKAGSIVRLSLQGTNKKRLVDYLNTTVEVLRKKQLDSKNQFAKNTIAFIDSTLIAMEGQLKDSEKELKDFRKDKNVFQLQGGGEKITEQLSEFDIEKEAITRKINYYNSLSSYLQKSTDYSKLPAPTVAGIEDPNIVTNVAKLIQFSRERSEMAYSVKSQKLFDEFDNQMSATKRVLLENINSAKSAILFDLSLINKRIGLAESTIRQLPEEQQELMKITRKYDLNDNIYNTFLQKRSEADIVKASNVSDIEFIDTAKDVGGGLLGPKTSVNYILALLLGILIPLVIVFTITLLDNSIHATEDIERLTSIPIIGIVGKKHTESNMAVYEKPKSPLAESFRSIRSSLQFLYKKQKVDGTKILMLTSSVGGEGKTFCSINMATVFALSEKRTVIVGLDLRKPRIFGDFNIENNVGVVNYLIGQKSIPEIVQHTHVPFLDVITAGPIPPNPSELLISQAMTAMIEELKGLYDYIILDTSPVGLVSDALELAQYCDATLYVVRQGVTKKGMLAIVNEKHKRGELHNISIVLNGFENRAQYSYGYGYGYGYGTYANGYMEEEENNMTVWEKVKSKIFKRK